MKGSFITVFLWVEFIAILHGSNLRAQQTRPLTPLAGHNPVAVVGHGQTPLAKNNFTSFTRKYTNRGTFWMARNKAYLNHPDANFADQYIPNTNAVEIFEKRTVNSKFYINKDDPGIVYSQRSSSPMHFKKNGQWITIDSRLQAKGVLVYEASNQEHPLGFDIKRKSSYIVTADGKTYFNNWKLYGENGSIETLLANADWTHYTAGDDGIAIQNIFPGIDAEMKVLRGSIKTSFIVHSNKFSAYKILLFRDSFSNAQEGHLRFSNGNAGNGLVSSADFSVGSATVFHIKEGVMYQKDKPSSAFRFIPYYLDHNNLTLSINSDFLNAPDRTGDVIIDPLVSDMGVLNQNLITGSHSNQDCSLDTACEYDFTVPAPAGAKLIDAQFSFAFTANDPCVGQDGAFSFASGTCVSQKYMGTAPGPGNQDFPNQSILMSNGANLAGCLPNPVCGLLPQNIPFSFFFYRKCHGPEGCDGSCISASKDLTITLVGRTFDSVSVTASPLNSCAGAPVTLTARGYFGVAPYTFVWPGFPQFNGDSVITVKPTTNTTYTVQVDDQCLIPISLPISKSINVNVFPKPPTPVIASNSPVCAGSQLILSVPPAPGATYFISNPVSGLGGVQNISVAVFNNVTAAYGGTWIAATTDANGCTSDTASTTVVINPTLTPTATITSSATNICTGTLVTFNATAINAGPTPAYQWLLNGQKVGTNSPVYSGSSFANNDAVSCIVSASGPCAAGFDVSNIIVLQVSARVTPTFTAIGPLCQNSTPPALPLTSKEGIAGTWTPAIINTAALGTVSYTFTPAAGSCANPASINITIAGSVMPTFPTIANSYCQNATAPVLPPTSKEGITGTWSPASINTTVPGTATYTFTPSAGSCATTASLNITIVGTVTPTFTVANSYCQNTTAPPLPPTSKEGIAGTWNPASINTTIPGTATYTFTPTAGSCATPASLNISIVGTVTPTFPTIANSYCQHSTAPALPPTSKEGIAGTWNPASINTSVLGTSAYTFTPSAGSCSASFSINITIVSTLVPTFNAIGPLCQNSAPPALPATSKEGVAGTWSPATINTSALGTVTYTFTPSAGSCATTASLNITILGNVVATFPTIANSYCQNSTAPVLPSTSKEGITGTWSPASINIAVPGTATYIFTPAAGSCSAPVSLSITVVGIVTPTFPTIGNSYCQNASPPALPGVSTEGITGTWSPASINMSVPGTTTYIFTPSAGSCAATVSLNITIVTSFNLLFDAIGPLCQNSTPPALPPTSKEGIAGTWDPAVINTTALGTVLYTFTPTSGSCANPAYLNITIVGSVTPTFPTIANSYCQNSTAPALPSTSKEGVAGTWSPSSINTTSLGTVAYTFTPSGGSCANPASININIVNTLTPTFDDIGPLCHNSTPPVLPSVSKEGITGTWNPATINTSVLGTATYQFTPTSPGSCAVPASINITIATSITPTFPTIAESYCLNDLAPALPGTSKEGINGTWNPSTISTANAGHTVYTFTPTGNQCGVPAQITITVNPPPVLTMGPDVTITDGASTTLNVSVTGNIASYLWKPSSGLNNPAIEDPVASPSTNTVYTLLVTDDNNCETSGSVTVTVSGRSKISVPNAFSPNGDGINDTWVITNLSVYPGATVDVFNRYGQPVFHSENSSKAWDGTYNGKPLPVGTYYYIIDLKNNEKKTAGSVTIFK
jgi:gliding motility-associated-like protein